MMTDWKEYLASIYFDPKHPGSFAGPDKLYKTVKAEGKFKIGKYRISKWLRDQDAYSLTKGVIRKFSRSRVIVEGLDSQWDVDLMDMKDLASQNDGQRYVLVAIDIFSRFARCIPTKSKSAKDVKEAFEKLLIGPRHPKVIRKDLGKEFNNREVSRLLAERGIRHFSAQNTEIKANYVERLIKTLKHRVYRYFIKHKTQRYVNVLQDIVDSYNNTVHSSLGRTPASIDANNEQESRYEQYVLRQKRVSRRHKSIKSLKPRRYVFKLGQVVRVSHIRNVFDREYSQKWTGELFKVKGRFRREELPVYQIEDWSGDDVEGTFYEPELQAVNVDDNKEYYVEKILKKRTRYKRREVLVRWQYWPKKYDSWIPEVDLKNYRL